MVVKQDNDKKKNVGIFIFNDVDILDFSGPYEVFSRTRLVAGLESRLSEETSPFKVFVLLFSLS